MVQGLGKGAENSMFFSKEKNYLGKSNLLRNFFRLRHNNLDLLYKMSDLNQAYYDEIKNLGDKELEHQIGRLKNYRKILSEIKMNNIKGDIIEFGTWRGFSLLWIAYLKERLGMLDKKIVGIDCFEGLPNSEGVFMKNDFSDTSLKTCQNNIFRSKDLYDATKRNIFIEKFLFSQKNEIMDRLSEIRVDTFSLVHIDSDISSSAKDILSFLIDFDLLSDCCYLLFDDYGCVDTYRHTVDMLMSDLESGWLVEDHSETKFTKNFKLTKR